MDGEQYPWPNLTWNRLQDYATKVFAVVTLSGSQQKGRMRLDRIYGKARDTS